jgi:hypothetical protein
LRLPLAAHRSERQIRLSVAREQSGDKRVERSLARLQVVRAPFVKRKEGTAIL